MLSKSLIQFSVEGQGCVPSILFDLRPNYGGGNERNSDLQKVPCTAALSAPNAVLGHCQPTPPPETPGHSRASLGQSLVGSLLLSPGSWCAQGSVCALQESVSQSCASSGSSIVGLMDTSSKRAYAIPRCCTQSPCPCGSPLLAHASKGDTQTQFCLSLCGVSGSWCTQGLFEPSECLWREWGLF